MPTISEAAAQLGVSVDTVRRRIHAGEIWATKVGGVWEVQLPDQPPPPPSDALERLVAELQRQLEVREREVGQLHILLGQRQLEPGKDRRRWLFWRR